MWGGCNHIMSCLIRSHACTHTHTHTHMHMHTHTCICAHTHTEHACTHTHTHTQIISRGLGCLGSGRYLPCQEHERKFPWNNSTHHSNWSPPLLLFLHQLSPTYTPTHTIAVYAVAVYVHVDTSVRVVVSIYMAYKVPHARLQIDPCT